MKQNHTSPPTCKENIFKALDSLTYSGGDVVKAEFTTHLYKVGALTEREAIDLTTEYIKREKQPIQLQYNLLLMVYPIMKVM